MHIRYRAGEVGETQRVVHWAAESPGGSLGTLCGLQIRRDRVDILTELTGMACMKCASRAALLSGLRRELTR